MSEEKRRVHPEEPAGGAREDVEAPDVSSGREDMGNPTDGPSEEERSAAHPQEPAEGGEDQVDG